MGVEIKLISAPQWDTSIDRAEMPTITFTTEPSIAELRETEAVYTRAMEYLVADGVKEAEARKSVCWRRLKRLHQALPKRYTDPLALFQSLQAHQRGQKAP